MEQIWFLRRHAYSAAQVAELVWTLSHRNILDFLAGVDASRQCRIAFEDLTARPQATMERLCESLGIRFHEDLVRPYESTERKMLDGIYPESMPMGDTKFHAHRKIDASIAERWRDSAGADPIGSMTWDVAEQLGYARSEGGQPERSRRATSFGRQRLKRQRHRSSGEPS